MRLTTCRFAVVLVLVLSAACGGSPPVAPTLPPGPAPAPYVPPPPIIFPPPSGSSRTYVFARELLYPVREFTRNSRLILYENGAFELRYPPSQYGPGVYRGAYQDADGLLMFLFEGAGRTVGTPWNDATGSLEARFLTFTYSDTMQQADFENAVYELTP